MASQLQNLSILQTPNSLTTIINNRERKKMAVDKLVRKLTILEPTTDPEAVAVSIAARPDTLDSKVLCLLDNTKLNADKILESVAGELAKRYNLSGVVRKRKFNLSKRAPQDTLDEIAEECDVAIVGVGD